MISATTMMTDLPLFSIITITRNNLNGLKRTQKSIEDQSAFDYEWIIIDGKSTDGTYDHLLSLSSQWVSEPDKGIFDAMNKGITFANGQYILFLNAGDTLADMDILATLARAISVDHPDFVYGDALETGGFYKKAKSFKDVDWGMFTHHQAMLYKLSLIGGIKYDDTLKIAADYGFTTMFLKRAKIIHYIPCAICIFEEGGVSQQNRKLGRQEQFQIRQKMQQCGPVKNIIIYGIQSAAAFLRKKMPELYFRLRRD